jgi:hypothetical protein
MSLALRYDDQVNRWIIFAVLFAVLIAGSSLHAQIFGPRASVTSLGDGFNMHNPPGPRASVTSLGPQGFTPRPLFPRGPFAPAGTQPVFRDRHRHFRGGVALPVYAVPYYYSDYPTIVDPTDTSMEENYGPGPTIFDRHGSNADSAELEHQYDERLKRLEEQVDAVEEKPVASAFVPSDVPERRAPEQPSTILVFRDGHTTEVRNYAIVGDALFDFSTGVRHKVDLSNLDLSATQKQNEDRGIDFRLPGGSGK